MVSSPEAHASRVGAEVLNDGGTAADSAVAVAFALAVTNPQAGSLGGGGFLLYRDENGDHAALDFRETAPAGLTPIDSSTTPASRSRVSAWIPDWPSAYPGWWPGWPRSTSVGVACRGSGWCGSFRDKRPA